MGNRENPYALEINDQDYIHCGKKLTYALDTVTKTLNIGGHIVNMNHIDLVSKTFPVQEHGLRIEDVERKDRQNWSSAQWLFSPCSDMSSKDRTGYQCRCTP